VRFTEGGEILLQCAGQVLDNLERVRVLLAEQCNTNSGRLSVAVPATFCHWLLPRLIDEFHERFPAIQISVVMTDVEIAADRIAHREIDIALVPTPLHHKPLALAPLGKDELVAVMSPSNLLASKERLLPADLKDQRFIMPSPGNLRFVPWDNFLIHSGVFPRIVVETDDLELAKHLAGQNVGITIAPRWSTK
jgi:DNA-binding transcriptional LysR family regulator